MLFEALVTGCSHLKSRGPFLPGYDPKVRSHGGSYTPSKWSSRCTSRTSGATESTDVIGDDGLATTTLFKRSII